MAKVEHVGEIDFTDGAADFASLAGKRTSDVTARVWYPYVQIVRTSYETSTPKTAHVVGSDAQDWLVTQLRQAATHLGYGLQVKRDSEKIVFLARERRPRVTANGRS